MPFTYSNTQDGFNKKTNQLQTVLHVPFLGGGVLSSSICVYLFNVRHSFLKQFVCIQLSYYKYMCNICTQKQ